MTFMPHNYKKLPEMWRIEELFKLSDKYPSGLEWAKNKARYKKGDQAGRLNRSNGYYFVSIDNEEYLRNYDQPRGRTSSFERNMILDIV